MTIRVQRFYVVSFILLCLLSTQAYPMENSYAHCTREKFFNETHLYEKVVVIGLILDMICSNKVSDRLRKSFEITVGYFTEFTQRCYVKLATDNPEDQGIKEECIAYQKIIEDTVGLLSQESVCKKQREDLLSIADHLTAIPKIFCALTEECRHVILKAGQRLISEIEPQRQMYENLDLEDFLNKFQIREKACALEVLIAELSGEELSCPYTRDACIMTGREIATLLVTECQEYAAVIARKNSNLGERLQSVIHQVHSLHERMFSFIVLLSLEGILELATTSGQILQVDLFGCLE